MRILYNKIVNHIKEQDGQMLFAYMFAAAAFGLLLWHIIDKIIAFSTISSGLQLIFT
jgi:hypothetical protein